MKKISLYHSALYCLKEKDIYRMDLVMSTLGYAFFKTIENNFQNICEDIMNGTISHHVQISDSIRYQLLKNMKPDEQWAIEVQAEILKGTEGLAKRLWPHLSLALITTSGGFAAHFSYLSSTHLKGIFCKAYTYAATEGNMESTWIPDPIFLLSLRSSLSWWRISSLSSSQNRIFQ